MKELELSRCEFRAVDRSCNDLGRDWRTRGVPLTSYVVIESFPHVIVLPVISKPFATTCRETSTNVIVIYDVTQALAIPIRQILVLDPSLPAVRVSSSLRLGNAPRRRGTLKPKTSALPRCRRIGHAQDTPRWYCCTSQWPMRSSRPLYRICEGSL